LRGSRLSIGQFNYCPLNPHSLRVGTIIKTYTVKQMSNLTNETLLEQLYDEAWIDYAVKHNLTQDQLDAIDQDSELGYLPEIADEAQRRFEELCQ